jgi:hypothetical protein
MTTSLFNTNLFSNDVEWCGMHHHCLARGSQNELRHVATVATVANQQKYASASAADCACARRRWQTSQCSFAVVTQGMHRSQVAVVTLCCSLAKERGHLRKHRRRGRCRPAQQRSVGVGVAQRHHQVRQDFRLPCCRSLQRPPDRSRQRTP